MADFFEDLGKKISGVANDLGKKAEDTIEVEKIKSKIRSLRRDDERDMMQIGRMVYTKFQNGEISDLDYTKLCEDIEKREEERKQCEDAIRRIQGI